MWIVFEKRKPDYGPEEKPRWEVAGATEHGQFTSADEACKAVAAEVGRLGQFAAVRVEPVTVTITGTPIPASQ